MKIKLKITLVALLLIFFSVSAWCGVKLIRHEKQQNLEMRNLRGEVSFLKFQIKDKENNISEAKLFLRASRILIP